VVEEGAPACIKVDERSATALEHAAATNMQSASEESRTIAKSESCPVMPCHVTSYCFFSPRTVCHYSMIACASLSLCDPHSASPIPLFFRYVSFQPLQLSYTSLPPSSPSPFSPLCGKSDVTFTAEDQYQNECAFPENSCITCSFRYPEDSEDGEGDRPDQEQLSTNQR
jgi:hypothetical protein